MGQWERPIPCTLYQLGDRQADLYEILQLGVGRGRLSGVKSPETRDSRVKYEGRPVSHDFDPARVIQEWQKPIYNLAYRWLGNEADAADAVQEAFVRVLEQLPKYDPGREFRPWIFQVATNSMRNGLRTRRRANEHERRFAVRSHEASHNESDSVEQAEREAIVSEQVQKLSEDQRELVALHYYCGLSQSEISEVLSVPKSTVQHRVSRALEALRERLRKSGHVALVPCLGETLASTASLPVPSSLHSTLTHLAATEVVASTSGAATATITPTLVGGIIMSKTITTLVAVAAIAIGFWAARVSPSFLSADSSNASDEGPSREAIASIEARADDLEAQTITLRAQLERSKQQNRQLQNDLATTAAMLSSTSAAEPPDATGGSNPEDSADAIDFDTLSKLLGDNLDVLSRMTAGEDSDLTAAEQGEIMAVQAAALQLIGNMKKLSDNPLYDAEMGPRIIEMLYGGALQWPPEQREQIRDIAQRVRAEFAAELDPDHSSIVERHANRKDMLAALSGEIEAIIPEDQLDRFRQADTLAGHLTRGRLAEHDIGVGPEHNPSQFYKRSQEAWSSIYSLQPDQQEPVREISRQLFTQYSEYLKRESVDPEFDPRSPAARRAFMEMQAVAERSIVDLLTEEQYLESQQSRPNVFTINPTGNINVNRNDGLGF